MLKRTSPGWNLAMAPWLVRSRYKEVSMRDLKGAVDLRIRILIHKCEVPGTSAPH